MKYKTFRNLLLGGVATAGVAGGGAYVAMQGGEPENVVEERPAEIEPLTAPETTPPVTDPAQPAGGDEVEAFLVAKLGQAGSGKVKDALGPGKPKINVYADQDLWNRAKVDRDRDEKWDEKWSFKEGRVEVQVSTKDDESYDVSRVVGAEPAKASAAEAAPAKSGLAAAPGVRPVDEDMLRLQEAGITGKKRKDATSGKAYKINLYSDDGSGAVNRAKVDLDRDDKWDEKWTFKAKGPERQIAPKDDEKYSETWLLTEKGWKKK